MKQIKKLRDITVGEMLSNCEIIKLSKEDQDNYDIVDDICENCNMNTVCARLLYEFDKLDMELEVDTNGEVVKDIDYVNPATCHIEHCNIQTINLYKRGE